MERFSIDYAVRGFHVYKDIWNPEIDEVLLCEHEFGNLHGPYAVSVVREDDVMVGHVPRTISALCYFFLRRNGMIICHSTISKLIRIRVTKEFTLIFGETNFVECLKIHEISEVYGPRKKGALR